MGFFRHFVYLFVGTCSGWTAPKARWPAEWICYTNITRQNNNQPDDYGTQIYSWSNRAQSVLHSDMFRAGSASTLLWRDNVSYQIENNYNSCCHLSQFDFPMPNVNWTDFLSYEGNDTFNGISSYLYSNASIMDVKYWVSIDTGLPVGWSNVPNATFNPTPIIQYFYAAVEYDVPLSADFFTLPSACIDAPSCPIIYHNDSDTDDDTSSTTSCPPTASDKTEVELTAALIVVPIIVIMIGLGVGFLGGKYYYERRFTSRGDNMSMNEFVHKKNSSSNSNSKGKNEEDCVGDGESLNPMNPPRSVALELSNLSL